jgi:hypothetical protein
MTGKLTDWDEHFVHQVPEPLPVAAIEHQHWRESYFFVTHDDEPDGDVVIVAMAHYPTRGGLDALVMGRVGGRRLFQHHARPYGDDPHTTSVGPVHVRVEEPWRQVSVRVDEHDGFAADLRFGDRTAPYLLRRGRLDDDAGALVWDQRQMIQGGTFDGWFARDGERRDVEGWLGQRDHSWGVRDHGRVPCWLWFAVQLPDGMFGAWVWENAVGARVFTDGCWAPAGGGEPVPVVALDHDLGFTGPGGEPVPWSWTGQPGEASMWADHDPATATGVHGWGGRVVATLADGSVLDLSASGGWCQPYVPAHGGGLFRVDVEAADGRRGVAIYEVTGHGPHRYFPGGWQSGF